MGGATCPHVPAPPPPPRSYVLVYIHSHIWAKVSYCKLSNHNIDMVYMTFNSISRHIQKSNFGGHALLFTDLFRRNVFQLQINPQYVFVITCVVSAGIVGSLWSTPQCYTHNISSHRAKEILFRNEQEMQRRQLSQTAQDLLMSAEARAISDRQEVKEDIPKLGNWKRTRYREARWTFRRNRRRKMCENNSHFQRYGII